MFALVRRGYGLGGVLSLGDVKDHEQLMIGDWTLANGPAANWEKAIDESGFVPGGLDVTTGPEPNATDISNINIRATSTG